MQGTRGSCVGLMVTLVVEPAVLVLTKHCRPDHWKCVALEKLQALVESVVDINLAIPSNNGYSARSTRVSPCYAIPQA